MDLLNLLLVMTLQSKVLSNEAAYIPPQCYTKTIDSQNRVYDLQHSYAFPEYALTNHWTNLFKDRSQEIAAISDAEILAYIRTDNYKVLIEKLSNNDQWDGFVPDCYFNFDAEGFDRDTAGNYTGWRAFAYYPFPGTFWPANGSTDDVIIRFCRRNFSKMTAANLIYKFINSI
jgi:hypothetical protein